MITRLGLTAILIALSPLAFAETETKTTTTVKPGLVNDVPEAVTTTKQQTTVIDSPTTEPVIKQTSTTATTVNTPTAQVAKKTEVTTTTNLDDVGPIHHGILALTLGTGVDFFAKKRQLDNALVPFASLTYAFTKHWGIDMYYGFFNTDSQNVSAGKPHVHGALFMLDGIYFLNPYKTLVPYILFGAGITGLSFNNNDPDNQGNINAGLGLHFFTCKNFDLRLEGRDVYTTVGGKNDILFNLGVSFVTDIG